MGIKHYSFMPENNPIYVTKSFYDKALIEHTHSFAELVCITSGYGIHTIDGHSIRVKRGDLFLIDYGMSHNFHALSDKFTWINCIFRPEFLCNAFPTQESAAGLLYYIFYNNIQADAQALTLNVNLSSGSDNVTGIFEDMLLEYEGQRQGYKEILEHYLTILLTKIARRIFTMNGGSEPTMATDDVISDVLDKLNNSDPGTLSAKDFADSYFMSQSAFSENFKKSVGISFLDYVTKLRVDRACSLLTSTGLKISEIQRFAGYEDSKSFHRAFKKFTQMTPTEYRASHSDSEYNNKSKDIL